MIIILLKFLNNNNTLNEEVIRCLTGVQIFAWEAFAQASTIVFIFIFSKVCYSYSHVQCSCSIPGNVMYAIVACTEVTCRCGTEGYVCICGYILQRVRRSFANICLSGGGASWIPMRASGLVVSTLSSVCPHPPRVPTTQIHFTTTARGLDT